MTLEQYSPSGFKFLPLVVKNLLIINLLCFVATMSLESAFRIDLTNIFGLHYFKSDLFRSYQFVTYMFFHADFQHILYNMFALWMFGYLLENVWGPKRFLTYYMITGIGAALVQTAINYWHISGYEAAALAYSSAPSPDAFLAFVKTCPPRSQELLDNMNTLLSQWQSSSGEVNYQQQSVVYVYDLIRQQMDISTIGASGAVFGILLAFGMMFPNMLVFLYFLFPIKAKWLVIGYGAIEVFLGISNNPSDNVAHFAHLGGMIFGFFLIMYWKRKAKFN
ncbi:MAG: rhomboid family intramembrane serine protease [Bacteroidetes bacterium]|nr:rhomboid family intramembrane serine protease [Bacteroidota bacterium]